MASGVIMKLLGGSRALTSQLVNQGLASGPGQDSSYDIGVGDVGLPREAPDVPMKSFLRLLSVVFEILWVPRSCICALKVSYKDLF